MRFALHTKLQNPTSRLMQSPLPLLIAVLGLAASTALAQEAAPAAATPAKAPESNTDETKAPAKKAAAPAANAEAKKPVAAPPVKSKPARRATFADRTPKHEGAEEEESRSFWDLLFFRHRRRETPPAPATPAPAPTPKPTPRPHKPKPASTPAPDTTTAPAATPSPKVAKPKTSAATKTPEKPAESSNADQHPKVDAAKPETTVVEKPVTKTPAPAAVPRATPTPKATPAAKAHTTTKGSVTVAPAATPTRRAPVAPSADADTDAQEKYRYELAKNKAIEDAEVKKLKEKADGATSDDEARKAQRAYNKALFNKMRSIDGTIKDRADRIEAAIMKRLDTAE